MPTPEEERRKRSLLEQALASLQGAGESASRIAGNTFDSIANPLGEAVKDIRDRFTPTPAGTVDARAFLDDSEYGPPASLNKLDSAVSAPPVQPVAAGDPMRPAATEEQKPQPPVSPKRLGPALRGGRTQSEMWGLPGAEPVDLEGGDPVVNKLKPETILAYAETPSANISSNRGLGERGGLSFAVGDNPAAAGQGLVGPNTPPQLSGGDLVDSWNEVKTAQKELGSFSDSAGKWWSVALAAMFPQYGSALNLIGNMKGNKYRAAMDKYESAYKSLRTPKHDVRGLGDGWYSMDGEVKQLPLDPKSVETEIRYGELPGGETVLHQIRKGSTDDPYYTYEDSPMEGVTRKERIPTYDAQTYRTKLSEEGKNTRNEENWEEREKAEQVRQENRKVIRGMIRQTSLDVAKARADLQNFAGKAAEAAADLLGDDINAMTASTSERAKMMRDETIRIAAELKAIQMGQSGTPPAAAAPAAQAPAPQGGKGRVLNPFAPAPN